jgi:hypothetical protein
MTTKRTYKTLIQEGKNLVAQLSQHQWELGDLALEVCPPDGTNPHNHDLQEFAEEIGIGYNSLRSYRTTADAWLLATRVASTAFNTHKILASNPKRTKLIKPGMTALEAENISRKERGLLPKTRENFSDEAPEVPYSDDGNSGGSYGFGNGSERKPKDRDTLIKELEDEQKEERLAIEASPEGKAARQIQGLLRKAISTHESNHDEAIAFFEKAATLLAQHAALTIQVTVELPE